MNEIIHYIPTFPPATIALLAAIWVGWLVWELAGRSTFFASRARKRAAEILSGDAALEEVARTPLEQDLLASGFNLGEGAPAKFTMIRLGLAAVGYVLMTAFNTPPIIALVGAGLAFWFPRSYIAGRAQGRGRQIDEEMPATLTRVASLINLQPDVIELLAQVANSLLAANPGSLLAQELKTTVAQARTSGAEQALQDLELRAPSTALASLAFSLRTYAQAGGAYARVLIESAQRSRAIIAGRNRARSKSAEATTAAKAIPLLLLAVSVMLLQDPIFRQFYRSFAGQVVVVGTVMSMLYGYTVIKSMVEDVG